jgi:hypothetical protein
MDDDDDDEVRLRCVSASEPFLSWGKMKFSPYFGLL